MGKLTFSITAERPVQNDGGRPSILRTIVFVAAASALALTAVWLIVAYLTSGSAYPGP